ncbi:gp3 [Mycobacterium phage Barnyard]|uniref:Uncharacterized protein n=1 Tax=Mycobacterium phage Barnyard TaxID=205880 RepID=Q856G9_9CAUD|nr:gp3 [Mycobacterium phage Barnyard]AAN02057.1 capsid accessory protein [Mycobacterium phage Barnyard]
MARKGTNARVKKLFTGRGKATRPIPVYEYPSERVAAEAAASDQRAKGKATKLPNGPRVGGVSEVFGTKVAGPRGSGGGQYNPTGLGDNI